MVAICYPFHQEHLTPANVSSHQVDIQCLRSIKYPPPEAAVSQPEVQEAKVSKLQMASEVEDIVREVDSIMGRMITNPVDDIVDLFMTLCNVEDDALTCKSHHRSFERMYKDEIDATLKKKMDGEISKMMADLNTYQLDMIAKMSTVQPPRDEDSETYNKRVLEKYRHIKNKKQNIPEKGPEESNPEVDNLVEGQASHGVAKDMMKTDLQACVPPASPASSPPCPEPGSAWLCSEQDQTPKLQLGGPGSWLC